MKKHYILLLILILIITVTGCKSKGNKENTLDNNGTNETISRETSKKVGSLDELIGTDEGKDINIQENDTNIEVNDNESLDDYDKVYILKEKESITQEKELDELQNYKISVKNNTDITVDIKESDKELRELLDENNKLTMVDIIVSNIKNTEPIIEVENVENDNTLVIKKKYGNKLRYTIYIPKDKMETNTEYRIYTDETKSYYKLIDISNGRNIKSSLGEVITGDVIEINNSLYIIEGISEVGSSWKEHEDYSEAYRQYRLTLSNIGMGPMKFINDNDIKTIEALDNKRNKYNINTEILDYDSTGVIEFILGVDDENTLINKYTINNNEYIDFRITVRINTKDTVSRNEINKADTIIKETAHKVFISNGEWILEGYR